MVSLLQLVQVIGLGLALLLPLTNPLTTVALLLGLSGNMSKAHRRQQSRMAAIYTFAIMMVAFYAGQWVMNTFGISIPGLRIAGGLIVAFIGFRMLFPAPQTHPHESTDADNKNIAFVPLAMPSTAGPGTIAMIISSTSSFYDNPLGFTPWVLLVAPIAIFLSIAVILWLCLLSADAIMKLVGKSGIDAISRLMGFLLVCMGIQFIINGILEIITTHATPV
ncbi:MarC family NAAT transporter [Serratia bockelmannii]|uniref:MarC family NAAT transporter n=1 Tax=Serratia bockelmannii TaxID=2703793 RepID=UPI00313D965E